MRSPHARPSRVPSTLGALLLLLGCFAVGLVAGATLTAWQWRHVVVELADELQDARQDLDAIRAGVCRSPVRLLGGSD